MHTDRPYISVIVSVLNGRATLQRCIDSVIGQTYPSKELIVIDGASTDGSVEVIERNAAAIAYWESQHDRGMYHAFNKALARARGEWIYFLGADDYLWQADVLERIVPHLDRAPPDCRIAYAQAAFVSERGQTLEILGRPWGEFRHRFLQGFMLPHQAVFHRRSLFEVRGPFDESFKDGGDYEMLLRELKTGDALFVPGIIVAGYQFGGGSSTPKNSLNILGIVRKAQRLNGIRFPGLLWYAAAARTLLRVALWKVLGERTAKRVLDWGRALLGKPAFWTRI
jgi:glycosyltransferase involved in cell wall biosynthesis